MQNFNPRNPRVASFTSPPHWLGVWVVAARWGRLVIYPAKLFWQFRLWSLCKATKQEDGGNWQYNYFRCSQYEAFRNFQDIDLGSVQKLDMICLEVQEQCLKTSSENRQFLRTGKAEAKALRDKEEVMRWHLSALFGIWWNWLTMGCIQQVSPGNHQAITWKIINPQGSSSNFWGHALLGLLWWQLQHQRGELQAPCRQWGGLVLLGHNKGTTIDKPVAVGNNPSSEDVKDVINHYSCYKFVRTPQMVSFDEPSDMEILWTVDILGMCFLTDFLGSRSFQILRRQRSSTLTCQRWSSQLCAVGQTHWEGGLGRGVKRAASRCCAKWMEMADYCIWDMNVQQRWTMCWGHAPCLWHKYERAHFCSVVAVVADERRPGANYIWNIWISCISHSSGIFRVEPFHHSFVPSCTKVDVGMFFLKPSLPKERRAMHQEASNNHWSNMI